MSIRDTFLRILFFIFQSGTLSDQTSNESGGGGGSPSADSNNAAEPSSDQLAMESAERETPSHAYNGPPPPVPPPHNRRQNPPHHQPHHSIGKKCFVQKPIYVYINVLYISMCRTFCKNQQLKVLISFFRYAKDS